MHLTDWIFIFQYFFIIITSIITCIYLSKQNIYEQYISIILYMNTSFIIRKRIFLSILLYKLIHNNIEFLCVIILEKKKVINNYRNEYKRCFKR